MAGVLGISPLQHTYRELLTMTKARQEDEWRKVSHLMAASLNANPFLKEHYKPDDVNPYRRQKPGKADDVFDAMKRDGFTQ